MKHQFIASVWNAATCGKCVRKEVDHYCDFCGDTSKTEVTQIGTKLSCDDCLARFVEASKKADEAIKKDVEHKLSLEQLINQVNRLLDTDAIKTTNGDTIKSIIDNAIKGNIKQFTDFFNAKIPSIMEIREMCDNNPELKNEDEKRYATVALLRGRVQYLSRTLFQFNAKTIEVGAEVRSIQSYMNNLIPQLRAEHREEYRKNEGKYNPPSTEIKAPPKPRQTTEDKLVEKYAAMMKIPVEKARILLKNKLKDQHQIVCTCSVTPGICGLHHAS